MTNAQTFEIITNSPQETIEVGRKLSLSGGQVVALIGPLGAGKTHLIKGIVLGLGGTDMTKVNSPTFVLVNEYAAAGGLTVYHIDAYRIETVREFEMLGFEDFCRPDAVVLIEWADKVLPALAGLDVITVELSHISANQRKIRIENSSGGLSINNYQ
jgi:tRNA threonylcarbamoyladenosine biosynthesis protein TsaE